MKYYGIIGMILAICVVVAAPPSLVSAQTGAVTGQEGKEQMRGTGESPEQADKNMAAYKEDLKKELQALDKKIVILGKKVKKQGSKLEGESKESWKYLKAQQKAAKSKLKDLSSTGKETWEKARSEADTALNELKKAYDKAVSSFK
jgi:hypothetical protein